MEPTYKLGQLSVEEAEALTNELKAVLEKYSCEMGVKASIEILKRIPISTEEGILSTNPEVNPLIKNGNDNKTEEKPNPETEEGSEGDSGKPA